MIQARIVYVTAQQKVTALTLPPHGATIGRSSSCAISTTDAQVSQQHAVFKLIRDVWHIEDRQSTNGTMVNGNRITTATRLRHMDVIACGALQLRFMLLSGAEQATLAEWQPISREPTNDFTALRSELTQLKKEQAALLEKLEQEGRELSGAKADNRQLRQTQDELRAQLAALRKQHDDDQTAQAVLKAGNREALAEKERHSKRLSELEQQLRGLQTALEESSEARRQAEQEAHRVKDRLVAVESECASLAYVKDEALHIANQRQCEMDELRRTRFDWDRYKTERDAETRVFEQRIQELFTELDEKKAAQRTLQSELANLHERYEDKNTQHRGLRSEFDQLNAELERQKDQAKRQIDRLAKDKEALRNQLLTLQGEAERAQKSSPAEVTNRALTQLAAELNEYHPALVRENEQFGRSLTLALRWHATASQTNPIDPAALRVRDAIEKAHAHADQMNKLLQQLASARASIRA